MSRILSVEGYNFVTYQHFYLDLEDDKSLYIGGDNKDTPSMESNGVGKSLIYDAIVWGLYDHMVRESSGKDKIIGSFDTHTYVKERWLDDAGRLIEIHRYRKHPKHKNNALIFIDGIPSSKVTTIKKLGTNAQIVKLLGIDSVAFLHSVVFSKGRSSICDAKEANRRKLLSHILNLDRFDKAQKMARKDKNALDKIVHAMNIKIASVETEVVELKARIEDAKLALEEEKDRLSKQKKDSVIAKEKRESEIRNLRRRRKHLRSKYSDLQERYLSNQHNLNKLSSLNERLSKNARSISILEKDNSHIHHDLLKAKSSIRKARCHTCGQRLRGETKQFKIIIRECNSLKKDNARKRKILSQQQLLIKTSIKKIKIDSNIEKKIFSLRSKINRIDILIKRNLSVEKQNFYDNTLQLKKRLKALCQRYKDSKKELSRLRDKIEEIEQKVKVADFWIQGFGPKGIKKFIINGILDYLEKKANEYLNELTDGYIKIKWVSEKELKKSGEKRDVLLLNVTTGRRGNKEYHVCSLGEQARVWLSMELALNTLIRSTIDLALVDEAFDGLDPVGIKRAIKMLSDEGSRRKLTCISHKPGIDGFFANRATVVMQNECSRIAA